MRLRDGKSVAIQHTCEAENSRDARVGGTVHPGETDASHGSAGCGDVHRL
jgi:hypothetical protein